MRLEEYSENEGISTRHSPEFTTIEIYEAYSDYESMMNLAEEIVTQCALAVHGNLTLDYCRNIKDAESCISHMHSKIPILHLLCPILHMMQPIPYCCCTCSVPLFSCKSCCAAPYLSVFSLAIYIACIVIFKTKKSNHKHSEFLHGIRAVFLTATIFRCLPPPATFL